MTTRSSRFAAALGFMLAVTTLASGAPKVEDSMAQRMEACTGCHGPQGRAAPDGYYPRIAGKPSGYLFNQMRNFRDGRRHYLPMTRLIAPLSDAYLQEIADHFAALDLPYAPVTSQQASAESMRRGEILVRQGDVSKKIPACAKCHGTALTGTAPAIPGLIGLPRDYLNAQLGAWRSGSRHAHAPDCMADIAKAMSPDDISAVSQWLVAQPIPAQTKAAATLPGALPIACGGVGAEVAR